MTIDLYMTPASPPCRAVGLTIAALGIDDKIQQRKLNFAEKENLTPEYLKLNPQHTIPTIVDDGFSVWESRAIIRYLVNKYGGADNPLYPADPKVRAVVDQRLDFDLGTLGVKFSNYLLPLFYGTKRAEDSLEKLQEALGFLNTFLEASQYAVGDNLTIADLSLVATVSTIEVAEISLTEYPNVQRWYELVKSTAPDYARTNGEPLKEMKALIDSRLKAK